MNGASPGTSGHAPLRVLFFEDDPEDVTLAAHELQSAGFAVSLDVADSLDALGDCLKTTGYDVILADYRLPGCTGMDGFKLAGWIGSRAPFILLSGALGEEAAVECLRSGVTDYVLKSNLARLPVVILRALKERDERAAREAAEEALRQSEARGRSLIEGASYAIFRTSDPEDCFLQVNPALVRMLGYASEADVLNLKLTRDVYAQADAGPEVLERCTRQGGETVFCHRDGSVITVRLRGRRVPDENGALTQWEFIAEDITERKRAETRISQVTRLYALLSQVNQACMRIREREILFHEVCRIAVEIGRYQLVWLGVPDELGRVLPVAQFGDDHRWLESLRAAVVDRPDAFHQIAECIVSGAHFTCNDTLTDQRTLGDQAGFERPFRAFGVFPLRVRNRSVGTIAFYKSEPGFSDPAELTLLDELAANVSFAIETMGLEERRERAEHGLRRSRDLLRRFAAHLQNVREQERTLIAREVHDELGQMLTVLRMDVESLGAIISKNSKRGEEVGRRTAAILDHIDSTIGTVRKISSELRPGVLDHLGLMAAIEWQTESFQKRTGTKCSLVQPQQEINLDSRRSTAVFRVFQESLTNIARHAQATEVGIALELRGERLRLEVSDNGRGIEPDKIADSNSLGLLGMRERVREFGGSFAIKGQPGGGSVVVVTMPMGPDVSDPVSQACPELNLEAGLEDSKNGRTRILLADDHAILRQGIREVLVDAIPGVICGEAGDGNEVLDAMEKDHWDLLILDISMPGRSGLSVLRSLKQNHCETPVLMLSMHDEIHYVEMARAAGASGYLHKASPTPEIVTALKAVLAGGHYFPGVEMKPLDSSINH